MDDDERRCALPGCDTVLEPVPGRPQRLYCTAAHRAAARHARRAAGHATPSADERAAAHLPWLAPPVRVEALHQHRGVGRRERGRKRHCRVVGGRHTLAVLGAAGVLAGGYALASIQVEVDGTSTAATPVSAPPVPARGEGGASTESWAQRASVALVSVNRQLDTLAHAEQEWTRLPERGHAGRPTAPLAALAERRAVLQRRQATLQSQLDAYRSLRERRRDLAVSEQHLATLQTALADVPPAPRRNAEQDTAIAALDEQRDLRIRQRDAQRSEVESLEQGVAAAAAAPLPDDGASTEQVTNDLLAAAREDDGTPEKPDEGDTSLPQILPGREEDDVRPRQEAETSGPPEPRGPRHGGEGQDAAADTSTRGRAGDAHASVPDGPDDEAIGKPDAEQPDAKHSDAKRADDEQTEKHHNDSPLEKEQKNKQNNEKRRDKQGEEKRRGGDDALERATTGLANAGRVVIQLVPGGRDAASDADVPESTDSSDRSPDRTPTARFATAAAFTDRSSEEESDETSAEKKTEQKKKSDKKTKKKSEKKKSSTSSKKKVSSESSLSEDSTTESDDEHDGSSEKKADKRSDDNFDKESDDRPDDKSDEESSDGDTSDD